MRKDEFFALTPRLFLELVEQERLRSRELQALFALLRRDVINFSMCHPKKAVELSDLLPSEIGVRQPSPARMSPKRRAAVAEKLRVAMGMFAGG